MVISELKVGDKISGPELFPGTCPDVVELTVESVKTGPVMSAVVFTGMYRGVGLGKVSAYFDGKSVQWGVLA